MSDITHLDNILNDLRLSQRVTRRKSGGSGSTPTDPALDASLTDCPVCMEQMTQPTFLPTCGHTFCRQCLKEISQRAASAAGGGKGSATATTTTIRCPIDRQPCVLPRNGVDGLPVNYTLRDILEQGGRRLSEEDGAEVRRGSELRECTECHSRAKLETCDHCSQNLCAQCIDLHLDVSRGCLRRVSQRLRRIKGQRDESLALKRSLLDEERKHFDRVRHQMSNFVNAFLSKMEEVINGQKRRLLSEVDKHQRSVEDKLGRQIHDLEAEDEYVSQCEVKIDKILKGPNIPVLESRIKALDKSTAKILHKSQQDIEPFQKDHFVIPSKAKQEAVFQNVVLLLGDEIMKSKESEPDGSTTVQDDPEPRAEVDGVVSQHVDIQWSVLGTGQGTAAGQLDSPCGIAVSPATRTICVADRGNDRLQWYNFDAAYLRTVGKQGVAAGEMNRPFGVASTPDGGFVISEWFNHRVQALDRSGQIASTYGTYGSDAGCFNLPNDVAVDGDSGHVYVCDSGNRRVQIFRPNGSFIGTFGSEGTSDGQFKHPAGIAVSQKRVIVTDSRNNKIQIFTAAGKHKRTIIGDDVEAPWGVAVNASGNTMYACCAAGIVVYRLRPGVKLLKCISSPVARMRPGWIALLSDSDAVITLENIHVVHRIKLN